MQAPDCQMKDLWGAPEDFRLVQGSTGQEEVGSLGQVRGCLSYGPGWGWR